MTRNMNGVLSSQGLRFTDSLLGGEVSMADPRRDYKWLEEHILSASTDVKSWPAWKSQGSTLSAPQDNSVDHPSNKQTKSSAQRRASS